MTEPQPQPPHQSNIQRIRRAIIGPPRDVSDPQIFHHVSLVAFLAWVGLGADGLSSSAYGPEEAYKALGAHAHLSIILVAMTAVTIAVISIAYSNLIQHFPGGGGGYLVATKLLGNRVGVVSGCALLVDYVLTITVSVAAGCDQLWSFLRTILQFVAEERVTLLVVGRPQRHGILGRVSPGIVQRLQEATGFDLLVTDVDRAGQ